MFRVVEVGFNRVDTVCLLQPKFVTYPIHMSLVQSMHGKEVWRMLHITTLSENNTSAVENNAHIHERATTVHTRVDFVTGYLKS